MSSRRQRSFVGFVALAISVAIGSYAWACIQLGSFTGLTWLCKATQTVTCNRTGLGSDGRNLNPTHSLSFYSQATGLTANATYDVRYAPGAHSADTDSACWTGTIFAGGTSLRTGSTGSWSGQGPLVMPAATGQYTMCALAPQNPTKFLDPAMVLITVL